MENEGEGAGAVLTFTLEEFNRANIFIRVFVFVSLGKCSYFVFCSWEK